MGHRSAQMITDVFPGSLSAVIAFGHYGEVGSLTWAKPKNLLSVFIFVNPCPVGKSRFFNSE
jgi:hypothetical protein